MVVGISHEAMVTGCGIQTTSPAGREIENSCRYRNVCCGMLLMMAYDYRQVCPTNDMLPTELLVIIYAAVACRLRLCRHECISLLSPKSGLGEAVGNSDHPSA